MSARVAINGFGRIGRMVMRAVKERRLDVDFVAINDVADLEPLGMVLRYDSIHGRYPGTVEWNDTTLVVDGDEIRVFKVGDKRSGDPFAFPWHDLGIDVVIESSGVPNPCIAASSVPSGAARPAARDSAISWRIRSRLNVAWNTRGVPASAPARTPTRWTWM